MKHCGIYIHVPFCLRKCQYCDFISFSDFSQEEDYFKALHREIDLYESAFSDCVIDSIFFGGGTPSAVSPVQISKLMNRLRKYKICGNAEITLEVNPATLTDENLLIYREAGINRLSIGLQSADDRELRELGRLHSVKDFLNNYAAARRAGFSNINVDIMFGIPLQTMESFQRTLEVVCDLKPEHISAYSLILEEGTPFSERNDLELPDEETEQWMYEHLQSFLRTRGYFQYEISNFAQKGFACRHNLKYWRMEDFIGFGLAAHSFYGGLRYANTANYSDYIRRLSLGEKPVIQSERESEEELFQDAVITGLRLNEGIDISRLKECFRIDFEKRYSGALERYLKSGHLVRTEKGYALTREGFEISNYILSDLL
ncbi:radical SAM family heme chaperone HemW [Acetivibrio sp. MSJd-27]|uniref:radical SAM family heme chaperone HemW n=1 Tax=Acetivibrio sp. MSJd-27 TaxID=2841523 RepID=UPI0015AAC1F5|nr:radical SAM family heme chaperone HemW [Acetivibrio sp. MSJd-27]MBU5450860.1 radical SAM family heme chaperone HemW [Acetivibrio sp. MSJd-27]